MSDNLWFFFSGHGWRHRGQDYLLLSDSDSDSEYIEGTALAIREITFHLQKSGAGNIIMLMDACRDSAKGGSIEIPKEQGIIKIASCQPHQLSYEIKPLGHGAFTYALLDALQRQGEGNCATLERLCSTLRNQVPTLTQHYHQKTQIPYEAVEPLSKYHLILLPDYLQPSQADLSRLREEALKAEINRDLKLAEIIWTRLLKFDTDEALASLYRIRDKLKQQPSSPKIPSEIPSTNTNPSSKSSKSGKSSKSVVKSNFQLPKISIPELPKLPTVNISRRQLLKGLGWGGAGIGVVTLGKILPQFSSSLSPFQKELPSVKTEIKGKESYQFQVVTVNNKGEQINRETKEAKYFTEDLGNGITLDMVSIPAGKFMMGTDDEEIERLVKKFDWDGFRREKPQHEVTIQSFFMGKFLVTQAQWREIASRNDLKVKQDLETNPSRFNGDNNLPVETVSWDYAVEFCARLTKLTGKDYRLPSEAEWEYACRADPPKSPLKSGTLSPPFYFGETITSDLANYNGNNIFADEPKGKYRSKTTVVGTFPPNNFGLYDMHGNLWEWCADDWHDNYENAPDDGTAWISQGSNIKVLRGGSWDYSPYNCRSAYRGSGYARVFLDSYGFRVVCS